MKQIVLSLLVALPSVGFAQDDSYPAADRILADAQAECAEMGDGAQIEVNSRALVFTDLDGDNGTSPSGQPDDVVVDFNFITCSLAASLWAGTGGAPMHFVLDGTTSASWTGHGWEVERMGADLPAVILIARHGTFCDSFGAAPCVQAIVAADGQFLTIRLPESNEEMDAAN